MRRLALRLHHLAPPATSSPELDSVRPSSASSALFPAWHEKPHGWGPPSSNCVLASVTCSIDIFFSLLFSFLRGHVIKSAYRPFAAALTNIYRIFSASIFLLAFPFLSYRLFSLSSVDLARRQQAGWGASAAQQGGAKKLGRGGRLALSRALRAARRRPSRVELRTWCASSPAVEAAAFPSGAPRAVARSAGPR